MVLSNDYHSICITAAALRKLIDQMLSNISLSRLVLPVSCSKLIMFSVSDPCETSRLSPSVLIIAIGSSTFRLD